MRGGREGEGGRRGGKGGGCARKDVWGVGRA